MGYHRKDCICGRDVGGDRFDCRDSLVGGTSTGRCGCGGNVGGVSNRRKCCICYLVEPITNTLKCLFSCGNKRC